jgi:ferritin-like metal-binding protein YciE
MSMSSTAAGAVDRENPAFEIFITGLRNAHAVEQQALQIMENQISRFDSYPEIVAGLRRHVTETHAQRQRIEDALARYDEKPSTLKEGAMGLMGNLAALAHVPAQDEVMKNMFANHAFENFEIAAYESLLTMAHEAGHTDIEPFKQSLAEEERMAQEVRAMIPPVTLKYMQLTASGQKASH